MQPHATWVSEWKNHATSPHKKSCNISTKCNFSTHTKIMEPIHQKKSRNLQQNHTTSPPQKSRNLKENHANSPQKVTQPLLKKIYATSPHKKSWNLTTQKIMELAKNHTTFPPKNYATSKRNQAPLWVSEKITQSLHPKNHATSQQKTLPELQNAAMRTSHWLSMCQIALSKSTEKVKKNRSCEIFVWKGSMIVLTTVTTVKNVKKKKKSFLFQYFWKEQLDTIDKRCDVLRAAFCDSCDVSVPQFELSRLITTYVFFSFITIWFFFKQYFSLKKKFLLCCEQKGLSRRISSGSIYPTTIYKD